MFLASWRNGSAAGFDPAGVSSSLAEVVGDSSVAERLSDTEEVDGSSPSRRMIQACSLTGRASGSDPDGTGSIPVAPAVVVAQLAVQRIVDPLVAGSSPDARSLTHTMSHG